MKTSPIPDLEPLPDEEVGALVDLLCQCFPFDATHARAAIERLGVENHRVMRRDGRLLAALAVIPAGQWWCGESLGMGGVAAVAVPPELRGRGIASRLMRATLEELQERGVPLSCLYASTRQLYRKAGYECAGDWLAFRGELRPGWGERDELEMQPVPVDPPTPFEELHRRWARRSSGNLDRRHPFLWRSLTTRRLPGVRGYLVLGEEGPEGYLLYTPEDEELLAPHSAALTPAAGRRLLRFFSDHGTTVRSVRWCGGPRDPLLLLGRERLASVVGDTPWMLRLVDVRAALEGRGYPAGVEATLELEVEDDWLPANQGRLVLEVADGRGTVREGGRGSLRLHVRDLATLYSGYLSPVELANLGRIEVSGDLAACAGAVFAGPIPWMSDRF